MIWSETSLQLSARKFPFYRSTKLEFYERTYIEIIKFWQENYDLTGIDWSSDCLLKDFDRDVFANGTLVSTNRLVITTAISRARISGGLIGAKWRKTIAQSCCVFHVLKLVKQASVPLNNPVICLLRVGWSSGWRETTTRVKIDRDLNKCCSWSYCSLLLPMVRCRILNIQNL